jgi:hypothetical protein
MTLKTLIEELQALASTTEDGGASLPVAAVYNSSGNEPFSVEHANIEELDWFDVQQPCILLYYK